MCGLGHDLETFKKRLKALEAVAKGKAEALKVLLDAGDINVNIADKDGKASLAIAQEKGDIDIVQSIEGRINRIILSLR